MSRRRILQQMAGIVRSPLEKQLDRQKRKEEKMTREWKQDLEYVNMIRARERGDEGAKPMPFAKQRGEQ